MSIFQIPYHTGSLPLEIHHDTQINVLQSKINSFQPQRAQSELIDQALDNPIGSPDIENLVKGKNNIVIITSDHTRPLPSRLTLPRLLTRIRSTEPSADIKIMIAPGSHRAPSAEELSSKFGQDITQQEQIIVHNAHDRDSLVRLSDLPSGGELWLNKTAVEADFVIAEGLIEPHFFAGFSGGRKSILPGIAGYQTVLANHCSELIAHPKARTGILDGNPVHADMLFAARQLNPGFILNVVLNHDKEFIAAVAGDVEKAHLAGCRFLNDLCQVQAAPADIVVSSNNGYPLDQNIYQSVKAMNTAAATAKPDAVIIVSACCSDGHGGEGFYRSMTKAAGPADILQTVLNTPQNETVPDQWQFQILARILKKHRVILVTDQCDPRIIREMHIDQAFCMNEALQKAQEIKGRHADITIIPDGVGVIVKSGQR